MKGYMIRCTDRALVILTVPVLLLLGASTMAPTSTAAGDGPAVEAVEAVEVSTEISPQHIRG